MKISLFTQWPEGFVLFGINFHAIGIPKPTLVIKHKDIMRLARLVERLPLEENNQKTKVRTDE